VLRVRLPDLSEEMLTRVREVAPDTTTEIGGLLIAGPTVMRLAALDALRAAGGHIESLSAQEGRLDEFYRSLVGGRT
jgi:hypothetical protein